MRKRMWARTAAAVLAVGMATAACGGDDGDGDAGGLDSLSILVPNSPGSGYDVTARTVAQVLEEEGILDTVSVTNREGAGGTIGLQAVVNDEGNAEGLLQMGLGVVGAVVTNQSAATLSDTTPVARLFEEPEAIVVPASSPFQTLDDLAEAWRADPGGLTVGGASAAGGPDHLTPHLLAQELGIDPTEVNYVAYDGGGELLAALLGAQIDAGATGVGEVAGQTGVRILAITSAEPVEAVDAPTLTEEGVDLVFTNWRGLVAPPGLSEEEAQALVDVITEMRDSEGWQEALETNGWNDAFLSGDDFGSFIDEQTEVVTSLLGELGLT